LRICQSAKLHILQAQNLHAVSSADNPFKNHCWFNGARYFSCLWNTYDFLKLSDFVSIICVHFYHYFQNFGWDQPCLILLQLQSVAFQKLIEAVLKDNNCEKFWMQSTNQLNCSDCWLCHCIYISALAFDRTLKCVESI
jgi:hypothetical protein